MNKTIVGITVGIVSLAILVISVVVLNLNRNSDPSAASSGLSTIEDPDGIKACDILTQEVAKELLGDSIQNSSTDPRANSNEDVAVSNCNYATTIDVTDPTAIPDISGVGLLVRSAKSTDGAATNSQQFEQLKPEDPNTVTGIGDKAYYSEQFKQLNVLKNGNWYIVTRYKDRVTNGSKEMVVELAKKLDLK